MNKKSVSPQRFSSLLLLFLTLCLSNLCPAQDLVASNSAPHKEVYTPDQQTSMTLEKFMLRFQRTYKIYSDRSDTRSTSCCQ